MKEDILKLMSEAAKLGVTELVLAFPKALPLSEVTRSIAEEDDIRYKHHGDAYITKTYPGLDVQSWQYAGITLHLMYAV